MLSGNHAERSRSITGIPVRNFIFSETYLRKILDSTQGFKACVSLNKMVERYGKEKIEEACGKVLLYTSAPSIHIITTVLKSTPDKQTKHTDKPDYSNSYGITRGVEYYKKGGASK